MFMPEILPTPAHHVPSEYFTRGCTGTGPPSPAINSTNSDQLPWLWGVKIRDHLPELKHPITSITSKPTKISQTARKGKIAFQECIAKKTRMWDKLLQKNSGITFSQAFRWRPFQHDDVPWSPGRWKDLTPVCHPAPNHPALPGEAVQFQCPWLQTFWKMKDRTINWKGKDLSHIPEQIKQDH